MTQAELKTVPSGKLFGYCASYYDDDRYWEEFVRRFNPCLTNSVYQTYRRFSIDGPPSFEIVSDLLQEIYVKILRDKCSALQRFRGASEFEAEVYLMLGRMHVLANEIPKARNMFERGLEIDPANVDLKAALAGLG